MRVFSTPRGAVVETDGTYVSIGDVDWDALIASDEIGRLLGEAVSGGESLADPDALHDAPMPPPIASQEVWAAGVTYFRSRDARMREAEDGGDFYDKVYAAPRPELFFKAAPRHVSGHRQPVRIRRDSTWNVPEPELTLVVSARGKITGYTIGNDMSSRSIEGENPLYLPQAKVYDQCCALGPAILIADAPLPKATAIRLEITRAGRTVFDESTTLAELKRDPEELVEYLFRDQSFPHGCFLLTGTGVVPPDTFTLEAKDEVRITIDGIGALVNPVVQGP